MDKLNHHENPELWFRSSPLLPFDALLTLIEKEEIKVTPRLGIRDGAHPKGYVPGTEVTLLLFDDSRQERLRKQVRVTNVVTKPLHDLPDWRSLQQSLSFFEKRLVAPDEMVSLIEFSYINKLQQEEP